MLSHFKDGREGVGTTPNQTQRNPDPSPHKGRDDYRASGAVGICRNFFSCQREGTDTLRGRDGDDPQNVDHINASSHINSTAEGLTNSFCTFEFLAKRKAKLWPNICPHVFQNCDKFSFDLSSRRDWPLDSPFEAIPHDSRISFFMSFPKAKP